VWRTTKTSIAWEILISSAKFRRSALAGRSALKGRSRAYALNARNPLGKTMISVAFNDRCDMVVATAVLGHDRPAAIEPGVIEFLNGKTVLGWAEVTLGL
jgi:hypothetical protein